MAFGNGTALMLKPERTEIKINYFNGTKAPYTGSVCCSKAAYVWTAHVRTDGGVNF